ncbi:MAG: NADH-quinone oxidoreductase subunit H [Candidatus Altiarchaeia archaeon]
MNIDLVLCAAINAGLILMISPFYMGLVRKTKALCQGRIGQPLLQPYYNLAKLLKKERIYSRNSSAIMKATPYINITAIIAAAFFIPVACLTMPFYGLGNIILFLYLLALAKFFMALAGLDAGSTFGGMSSSREMSISSIIEPITIVVFAALVYTLHSLNFYDMFFQTASMQTFFQPALLLISIPLFIVLIVETARVPVDNPETHLELTMVHEGMILEYTGRDLALMELSNSIKQTLFMAVLINVILPWGLTTELSVPAILFSSSAFLVKGAILAVLMGLFESVTAKMRLFALPGLFALAFFFSILTVCLEVFA